MIQKIYISVIKLAIIRCIHIYACVCVYCIQKNIYIIQWWRLKLIGGRRENLYSCALMESKRGRESTEEEILLMEGARDKELEQDICVWRILFCCDD